MTNFILGVIVGAALLWAFQQWKERKTASKMDRGPSKR
jgi:hypothetical protein